jgi:hypothetical protein
MRGSPDAEPIPGKTALVTFVVDMLDLKVHFILRNALPLERTSRSS